ncbi:MAG: nucleotidyltransferase family protein, partial [Calditrichaeota bacterium]|nr:nucleotidyltransferase family protein [Calditrichota bacterium]
RLKPQTDTIPKVLVHVAGKPMLGHLLDDLINAGIRDVVCIVGYLKEQVIDYVTAEYPNLSVEFVEQKEMLGLGHAIYTAKDTFNGEDILIALGDTLYDVDFSDFTSTANSALALVRVEDPRRFGVAELDSSNKWVRRMVEKPEKPKSDLAIAGLYYIKNSDQLVESLDYIISNDIRTKNEFQVTDALQLYIDSDQKMDAYIINGWYDCGLPETLLETNRVFLEKMRFKNSYRNENSCIIEPCAIHPSVTIKNSIVGPYVSLGKNCEINNSIINNSILAEQVKTESVILEQSIIGNDAEVSGSASQLNLGANKRYVQEEG